MLIRACRRTSSKLRNIIYNPLSSFSSTSSRRRRSNNFQPMPDLEQGSPVGVYPPPPAQQASPSFTRSLLSRSPFFLPTNMDLHIPFFSRSDEHLTAPVHMDDLLQQPSQQRQQGSSTSHRPDPAGISTRVWSEEEKKLDQGRAGQRHSVASAEGVVVETLVIRETETAEDSGGSHQQHPR